MKISGEDLRNYFVSTVVSSIFLVFIVSYSEAPLTITCEAGGPYAKNATINVIGNVTNASVGGVANVSTNVSVGGVQQASSNTTSDDDGRYHASYFLNLDFDTYTVATSAQNGSTTVYCTDTIGVQLGVNTSCANKIIRIEGIAVYSSSARAVTSGNATVGIAEERVANSTRINSTGGFRVPVSACLKKGSKYTLNVLVDDDDGRRSFLQQMFIAP